MYNEQEKILNSMKSDYDHIIIPQNIDDFIKQGIVKYPMENNIYRFVRFASVAAVIAFFILAATIRMSPIFADYLQNVPVFKYIVWLVNQDKGLKAAVENNFVQNIGTSDEHGNIKFTVDSVIVDQSRMVVFYTIENNNEYMSIHVNNVKLKDENNKPIEAECSYRLSREKSESKKMQDSINISFAEDTYIPAIIHLEVAIAKGNINSHGKDEKLLPYTWKVGIPVDKSTFENMKQVYEVAQTVEIEGQKINVNKATVYPTSIAVELSFPDDNSMQIFAFDDAKIVNDKGEALYTLKNTRSAFLPFKSSVILHFESNYFDKSEGLYLDISSIRALDKKKLDVLVDIDKEELLKAPDERLILKNIKHEANETTMNFLLDKDDLLDENNHLSVFNGSTFDNKGNILKRSSMSTSNTNYKDFNQGISLTIQKVNKNMSPIKLTITDYPNRIKGNVRIKIK